MSLVQNPIDALFNGVSQQPANMRLPSQAEESINAFPSVADGLEKRAPAEFIAKLSASGFTDPFIHLIDRDADNQYALVVQAGGYAVYDLTDGLGQTILYEASNTYLNLPVGAKASESFAVVTVADYSFIVNKTVTVGTIAMPTSQPTNYSRWYLPDNWTRADDGSRYYSPVFGTNKGSQQTLQDLPNDSDDVPPVNGDFYTIEGNSESGFSRYYVLRQAGVWVETHAFNGSIALDETTMPHAIVNESPGTFVLREFGWIPRLFGDDDTNPVPSFVGKTISDIGYHKNRLVLSSGENIIFSGAGDYGNFFRNTVTQLLDSDVVDVAVSTKQVSTINHILPADNNLMFFSKKAQFSLNVDQLLTPSTVSIDVATSYEMNPLVKPINIGPDVYFPTETGNFSRMREYNMTGSGDELTTDATDITAHVDRYIPKNVIAQAGSSNEDFMAVLSSDTPNLLYIYKFFYSGGEKVQSAWGKWQFATDDIIQSVDIVDQFLYMLVQRTDGTFLYRINLRQTEFPLTLTHNCLLDKRYIFQGADKVFDSTNTTFTMPYDIDAAERDDFRLMVASGLTPGRLLDPTQITWTGANTFIYPGNWTSTEVICGLNYTMEYTFSQQYHRTGDGMAITTGSYKLRSFSVVYENYATFNTIVDPYGNGNGLTEDIVTAGMQGFTAKTIGASTAVLGQPTFEDGVYMFQIYGDSKDAVVKLTNDQPYGGSFVSCTVEGFFTTRR